MKYALIAVTENGLNLAEKLQRELQDCDIYAKEGRQNLSKNAILFAKMRDLIAEIFYKYQALIFSLQLVLQCE